jgi:hypothetical protein
MRSSCEPTCETLMRIRPLLTSPAAPARRARTRRALALGAVAVLASAACFRDGTLNVDPNRSTAAEAAPLFTGAIVKFSLLRAGELTWPIALSTQMWASGARWGLQQAQYDQTRIRSAVGEHLRRRPQEPPPRHEGGRGADAEAQQHHRAAQDLHGVRLLAGHLPVGRHPVHRGGHRRGRLPQVRHAADGPRRDRADARRGRGTDRRELAADRGAQRPVLRRRHGALGAASRTR